VITRIWYQQETSRAEDLYKEGKPLEGLALFDRERRQIDAGWQWAMAQTQSGDEAIDQLLIDFANATVYAFGELRYTPHDRIPQLKAQRDAARRLGNKHHEGSALNNLGLAYQNLGNYHRAIEYLEQSLVFNRKLGNQRVKAASLTNLGGIYLELTDHQRAIEYHEQALVIRRKLGDRVGEGNTLGSLGAIYIKLTDHQRAIEYLEQSLVISRKLGDRVGEGNTLGNLGIVYHHMGDFQRAIDYYESCIKVFRELGYMAGVAQNSWNLGLLYERLGKQEAMELIEQAAALMTQIGYQGYANHYTDHIERMKRYNDAVGRIKRWLEENDNSLEKVRRMLAAQGHYTSRSSSSRSSADTSK
jgi:tetratricopeptide (TPR) repeat protein